MSLLKRLSATLFARLDGVVGEIEDHEAVAQTCIGELRQQIARARARLNRMQREEQLLDARIDKLHREAEDWGERARACAAEDEARALACLERRQRSRREAERLTRNQVASRDLAARLSRDIDDGEARLEELTRRYTEMRARQCGNAARIAGESPESDLLREVDSCFERWDARLGEQELRAGTAAGGDALEESFARQERDTELRAELDELLNREQAK
ncbi:hypothetical protein GCM10011348_44760 [Marinobacterium nitratireducens]|uniref:PspA/IM30 family protein n=1 Tax=Marinobacterium nitratireducens TaxID=518897 RepID=A0A917ZQ48_9GAMM|nr:PspA/IM30 family protein [Marinobacterium nitratireducens]GGO88699.1 hypothetical protein GCM10011348_44760 [Marinobacterium nitratireducens]